MRSNREAKANLKILITGPPKVGKTTLIKRILNDLEEDASGFYTEEIKAGGKRLGFKILTLDGKEGVLAHLNFRSPNRVGRYSVNREEFEGVALPPLEKALKEGKFVVIDEIGKMELFSVSFQEIVKRILDSENLVLASIGKSAHPFIREIKSRRDCSFIEVTSVNRDHLVSKITQMIKNFKVRDKERNGA